MCPSYAEIQEQLNLTDFSGWPKLHMAVLRNIMLEPIEPYLRFHALQIGFEAKVRFGQYDMIFQESVGNASGILAQELDCVLVFMSFRALASQLNTGFAGLSREHMETEVSRVTEESLAIIKAIRRQTPAMILWHAFELPTQPALGIWDTQSEKGQLAAVRSLNESLRKNLRQTPNSYLVDTNLCLNRIGAGQFYDARYWHIGRAPYTREALQELAREEFKYIRPLKGKNKKCLVLDCDNTLWGGIIGEDGLSGIKIGQTHPGSSYYEFQQEVVNLYHRGIIIALCSKNNEEDVWEVFRNHPDMVLKEKQIAAARINWQDKASNLRQLAAELNIGLDSMVFIDDSEFEVNLVRSELPEVEVIHLPAAQAVHARDVLAACGLFDTLTLSEEDKKRGAMYRAESKRKQAKAVATDLESYYRSLEMEVHLAIANEFSIPRIAQQTQKTNQFNLTTRRYTEADIKSFADGPDYDVISLRLVDRYGDSGIVGTCVLKYEKDRAIFDSFLLSCRILGRGVEDVFLSRALLRARNHGCLTAVGDFYATKKNAQVEHFYSRHDFTEVEAGGLDMDRRFHYDLTADLPSEPQFFKQIHSGLS